MLQYFSRCSQGRAAWLLMGITALGLELTALYFQHIMLLQPCVMCIYERCALFGIVAAALLGAINPRSNICRYSAIALWLYSSWEGLMLAWKHSDIMINPSPFNTCDFMVSFPSWLPLDQWLPAIFHASGDCSVRQWQFLSFEMPQWLMIIFFAYLVVAIIVLLSQFVKNRRRDLFNR